MTVLPLGFRGGSARVGPSIRARGRPALLSGRGRGSDFQTANCRPQLPRLAAADEWLSEPVSTREEPAHLLAFAYPAFLSTASFSLAMNQTAPAVLLAAPTLLFFLTPLVDMLLGPRERAPLVKAVRQATPHSLDQFAARLLPLLCVPLHILASLLAYWAAGAALAAPAAESVSCAVGAAATAAAGVGGVQGAAAVTASSAVGQPLASIMPFLVVSAGVCAAVCSSAGHELIHSRNTVHRIAGELFMLWTWHYAYVKAHPHHHRWVGTPQDHSTARKGELFFVFFPRYVLGSCAISWQEEVQEAEAQWRKQQRRAHPPAPGASFSGLNRNTALQAQSQHMLEQQQHQGQGLREVPPLGRSEGGPGDKVPLRGACGLQQGGARPPMYTQVPWRFLGGFAAQAGITFVLYLSLGLTAVQIHLGAAFLCHLMFALMDYGLHYGLSRSVMPDGRYEPVTQYLSFNSAYRWENAAILTVLHHSDHHMAAAKPYTELGLAWPAEQAAAEAHAPSSLPLPVLHAAARAHPAPALSSSAASTPAPAAEVAAPAAGGAACPAPRAVQAPATGATALLAPAHAPTPTLAAASAAVSGSVQVPRALPHPDTLGSSSNRHQHLAPLLLPNVPLTAVVLLAVLCPPLFFRLADPHVDAANAQQRLRARQLLEGGV